MSNNMRVMLVGPGNMGKEYCKVLKAQGREPIVIGRGERSARMFEEETGIKVIQGGIDAGLKSVDQLPEFAIVATTVTDLASSTLALLAAGVKHILVEKPAGLDCSQVRAIVDTADAEGAEVYVAYNRRFYASVAKALEIIKEDGGVSSFNFEFTEWGYVVEKAAARYNQAVKECWFVANSTHVVDLAFFLGGEPKILDCHVAGSLTWHKTGCVYAGSGETERGALFSYQANWAAPGRWGVEVLTPKHRLYLRPMEKLAIQELQSVSVNPVEVDDVMDIEYKPGLYRQVESFLYGIDDGKKLTVQDHLRHMEYYAKMEQKPLMVG